MILSPGRGFVFVHAPKTGGTSLMLALEAGAHPDDILIGDTPLARRRRPAQKGLRGRGRLWKHSTLADIEGILPADRLARLQAVTLVRNPWDRLVSYYHWLRDQTFAHPVVPLARSLGFGDFVRHPMVGRSFAANPYGRYISGSDGRERPALFLRLEHLSEDLPRLEALLGGPLGDLPHANRSDRPAGYAAQYDGDTRDLVGRICAADIARFGYRFAG